MLTCQLGNELHKIINRKFKKLKVYSSFEGNIWGVDLQLRLADMQLISKYNKGIQILLCVIDIFSKYVWVIPLKDKTCITITNAFQEILDNAKRHKVNMPVHKPNKIWVDKGSEFYNSSMKSWFPDNKMKNYSTSNEGKSVLAERFIRTLKNELYKHMTAVSKNVYIIKLDNIVNKYDNTYYTTLTMNPIDVKPSSYIDFHVEQNDKNPKFKFGDHVGISNIKT